ncbi:hypothetical protein A245_09076, partial [Pseudomonas syringae pv. actinidiae ICMP 19096]
MQVLAAFLEEQGLNEAAFKRDQYLGNACPKVATSAELAGLLTLIDRLPETLRVQQRQG